MIIGIVGKAGAGKDTVFEIIYDLWESKHLDVNGKKLERTHHQEFTNVKFAAKVKQVCSLISGIPLEHFNDRTKYNNTVTSLSGNITIRSLMQKVGEGLRKEVEDSIWIRAMFAMVKSTDNVVITDVRYPNEVDAIIAQHGFLIKITRPDNQEATIVGEQAKHSSETALDGFNDDDFDYLIINNGTLDDLKVKVKLIMEELWQTKD